MHKKHATPEQFLKALAYEFPGLLYDTETSGADVIEWIATNIESLSPRVKAELKSMACVSVGDRIGVKNG